jgi:hypothetical protein
MSGARGVHRGASSVHRRWGRSLPALIVVWLVALAGLSTAEAVAADSIYWTNSGSSGAIRVGNSDGSGSPGNVFTAETSPFGLALDPAGGKIYWSTFGGGSLRTGNLNGTGVQNVFTGESRPYDVTTDPAAGKIYWTDFAATANTGLVRVGNLDGTGGQTLFPNEDFPSGVAIDPAGGKIYWGQESNGVIRVANLNGTGATNLFTLEQGVQGVAIDVAARKIYWATIGSGAVGGAAIRVGNLDGTGARDLFTGETGPDGVAIDATAGKIYWASGGTGSIRVGNLDGNGGAKDLFPGEDVPRFVALLKVPLGAGPPIIAGGSSPGSQLSCSQGAWADNVPGAFLYRAPQSFAYQWSRDGTDISGATSSSYSANVAGSYTCKVTASNQAGSAVQTSVAKAVAAPRPAAPVVGGLVESARRWREGNALPHIARKSKTPVGTTFRFNLNEAASVRFAFTQRRPGRRVAHKCVAQTSRNKRKPKCKRSVTVGALGFAGHTGANSVRFQGRVSGRKKLKPGRYTLVVTATNSAAERSAPRSLTFEIVKR